MIKNIFYVFILSFLISCASLNPVDKKSFNYLGKLLINTGNNSATFNININLFKDKSIIQIKKPFYGNVLNIRTFRSKDIFFGPSEDMQQFKIPDLVNANFHDWLTQCLLSQNLNIFNTEGDINYQFICNKERDKTFYNIKYQEYNLEGYILKK
tara:strand:+ start:139 stop:600 length:462 start_codon:yes stop_codon:yes gene_type:complete